MTEQDSKAKAIIRLATTGIGGAVMIVGLANFCWLLVTNRLDFLLYMGVFGAGVLIGAAIMAIIIVCALWNERRNRVA